MVTGIAGLSISDEDVPYEEEIFRNPFSVKHWLRYIEFKKDGPSSTLNILYERALKELPGSYKIWYSYLKLRRRQVEDKCVLDAAYEDVNSAFERSLVFMHKMPRIWIDYCDFLVLQCQTTRTRKVFDRALRALPITQHHRIWPLYITFVTERDIPETAVRVYRRYLKLCPEEAEDYIQYLIKEERLDEAAVKLAEIVNKDSFVSKYGKPKHQLWNELCELISENPDQVHSVNADAIIRDGIRRFTDQIGHFWNSLADYYIRSSLFERARDIYEEAIQTVMTVRDFTQVFDAYGQFEEGLITAKHDELSAGNDTEDDELDIDLHIARLEDLMDRRALLLNSVILRQNPHNVHEWHKRVKLLEGNPKEIIYTYTEAVQTVEPNLAVGKLNTLWIEFAKFYESNKQLKDARIIFGKAIQVPYTKVDDLAAVWCEWAEMEIRHSNIDAALKLMHRATAAPPQKVDFFDQSLPVQDRLYKSLKIWSLYADLEESCGTFKSAKAVYDGIIDLKIATPQIIINYGLFLEENNYFEEAFKAYEKGIALFRWPNVYDIWNTYLTKFLKRYGGKKLERARDLFEQCLERCPPKFAKTLYLLYAKLEENHGLARHAMSIYERATGVVLPEEQFEMFNIYIRKAAEILGVTYTRQIYEKAIEVLTDNEAIQMCIQFADLERKLGEIDRARVIYAHCSQMCDPRTKSEFWQTWKEFEVQYGNVDTVKEMLRIKRSVQATYNTQVNFMSAQMLSAAVAAVGGDQPQDSMQQLEERAKELAVEAMKDQPKVASNKNISFVAGESSPSTLQQENTQQYVNPDQIDLSGLCDASDDDDDMDVGDDDMDVGDDDMDIEEQAIPEEVFLGLEKTVEHQ